MQFCCSSFFFADDGGHNFVIIMIRKLKKQIQLCALLPAYTPLHSLPSSSSRDTVGQSTVVMSEY